MAAENNNFEAALFKTADKLRKNIDAAEYKNIVQADLVDCIAALPKQLFYNTGIPATIWILRRGKAGAPSSNSSHRAENGGFSPTGRDGSEGIFYEDIKGFCKSATLADIEKHSFVLTLGRYVGIPDESSLGNTILRFENSELLNNPEKVFQRIQESFSPAGRDGREGRAAAIEGGTTIQKFYPALSAKAQAGNGSGTFDALSDRTNIVVVADEAHRSQYGFTGKVDDEGKIKYGNAKHLRDALPHASFIGFTGIPIEKEEYDAGQEVL